MSVRGLIQLGLLSSCLFQYSSAFLGMTKKQSVTSLSAVPQLIVFDLDNTLWTPGNFNALSLFAYQGDSFLLTCPFY